MKFLRPIILFDGDNPNGEAKSDSDSQLGQINELLEFQGAVVEKKTAATEEVVDDTPAAKAATQEKLDPRDLIQKVVLKKVEEAEPIPEDKKEEKETKVEVKAEKKEEKKAEKKEDKVETQTAEIEDTEEAEEDVETEEAGPGLLSELERLSTEVATLRAVAPVPEPTPIAEQKVETSAGQTPAVAAEEAKPAIVALVTDESLADTLTTDGLNKFGNDVIARANTAAIQTLVPAFKKMIVSYTEIARQSDKFYNDNPELADKKGYVNVVMNEIAAEKPELKPNLTKLLEATKKEVTRRLKVHGQQETQPKGEVKTRKKVATPVTKATTKTRGVPESSSKPEVDGQQGQIDTMISTFS